MSYCLPEASCAHVRHQQEKSRGPLGFSFPLYWSPQLLGRTGGGHWCRVCRKHLQWWLIRRCILKGYAF